MTWVLYPYWFAFLLMPLMKLALSEEMMFEYKCNIHVYCTGVGAIEPMESNFMFRIIDI